MLKKLRRKFIWINMITVTVMLCAILGLIFYFTQTNLEEDSIRLLQSVADRPGRMGRPGFATEQINLPHFILQQIGPDSWRVSDNTGFDLSDEALLQELVSDVLESGETTAILRDYDLRYYRAEKLDGTFIVFADITSELATLRGLIQTCAAIGILSFCLFFCISLWLSKWAIRPVSVAWEQQKQFLADASHELKTPLAVIMTNAELLQNPQYSEAERSRFSESILTMSRQMRALVEGLLQLARADNGAFQTSFCLVSLSKAVSNAVLPFEPLYFEQGLGLSCHIEDGIDVSGSAQHLQQVVDILLDNAQKYATPGSTVQLGLARQGGHCRLSVASQGQAISRADLKNIFKRFYRVDKSRTGSGSYGLGLSIAEGIVTAHRGKIWAESVNGINTFHVQLPAQHIL